MYTLQWAELSRKFPWKCAPSLLCFCACCLTTTRTLLLLLLLLGLAEVYCLFAGCKCGVSRAGAGHYHYNVSLVGSLIFAHLCGTFEWYNLVCSFLSFCTATLLLPLVSVSLLHSSGCCLPSDPLSISTWIQSTWWSTVQRVFHSFRPPTVNSSKSLWLRLLQSNHSGTLKRITSHSITSRKPHHVQNSAQAIELQFSCVQLSRGFSLPFSDQRELVHHLALLIIVVTFSLSSCSWTPTEFYHCITTLIFTPFV